MHSFCHFRKGTQYMLYVKDIVKATGGELVCGDENRIIKSVSTDSRCLDGDTLFIPIKGERFDGHDFLESAEIAITEKDVEPACGKVYIKTGNTVKAFGAIAKYYKSTFNIPTVSVVGSVGKTTTRDMTGAVLSQKYKTLKTEKNYNNDIGVPIMVMKLESSHQAAVLELGMSALGEIEYLADIVRPDTLIMTNIGMSHIENLGSQENIFRAKMEGTKYLTDKNTVIANFDDKFLRTVGEYGDYKVLSYAVDAEADIKGVNIEDKGLSGTAFDILCKGNTYHVELGIPGVHNVYNALAAFGAGVVYGVPEEDIVKGLESAGVTGMRMEIVSCGGIKVINDCYNASPSSMEAALKVLAAEKSGRKIAVLGDIFEMGEFGPAAHEKIGELAAECADAVICAGKNAAYIAKGAANLEEVHYLKTTEEAAEKAFEFIKEGDTVLVKASRGMHFEKIVKRLTEGRN